MHSSKAPASFSVTARTKASTSSFTSPPNANTSGPPQKMRQELPREYFKDSQVSANNVARGWLLRTMFFTFQVGTLSYLTYRLTELYKSNKLKDRMRLYIHDWGVRVGPRPSSGENNDQEGSAESMNSDVDVDVDPPEPAPTAEPQATPADDVNTAIMRVRDQVQEYLRTLESPYGSDTEQIEARLACLSKLRTLFRDVQDTFNPDVQDVVLGYIRHTLRGRTFGLICDL